MNIRQIAAIGVALVAGLIAFFLMSGNEPEDIAPIITQVEEKTVRVLVSDIDLERGNRLSVESLKWVDWPEKYVSEQYLTEGVVEIDELNRAVVRSTIIEGEPLIERKIVRAGSSGMLAAVLEPGMRAITTRVSPETASGGFILPGDRVDIYYTENAQNSDETIVTVLFEDVKVLALDAFYAEESETSNIAGATATLELSPADAEFFTKARNSRGQITLALRSVFEPTGQVESQPRQNVDVVRYGRI
ncbi:MAG: Flp pilus assembly protein CpaB [Pseudomonadota bacterium]